MSPNSTHPVPAQQPFVSCCAAIALLCFAVLLSTLVACGDDPMAPVPVAHVTISPANATVFVDSTVQYSVSVRDSAGSELLGRGVDWSTSDPGVAGVDETGLVLGMAPGQALIRAEVDGVSDSAEVTVMASVARVTVSPGSWTMLKDLTVQLTATLTDETGDTLQDRAVTWTSSDETIATVDSAGLVLGVRAGSAMITVTSEGESGTAEVTVGVVTFTSLGAGSFHTCGLSTTGAVYCWGGVPAPVGGGLTFAQLSVGSSHNCALTAGGLAYCWGLNDRGELGDGSTDDAVEPVAVEGGHSFAWVSAGIEHTCGVTASGEAYCWGHNSNGQLGDSSTVGSTTAVPVYGGLDFAYVSGRGFDHSCGMTTSDDPYCWGNNNHGQLGDGTSSGRSSIPLRVSYALEYKSIVAGRHSYSCAIASDDVAYCWGHNDYGQLGRGWASVEEVDVTPVSGGLRFVSISGSLFHVCGVTTDGDAYCWGNGGRGELGDGMGATSYAPVPVAGNLEFTSVTTGDYHSCGLTTAGVAYCWGWNWARQLGTGDETDSPIPVRVVGQP